MKQVTSLVSTLGLFAALASPVRGAVYFQEDFNNKVSQDLIDLGWDLNKNEFAKETGTDFGIAVFPFDGPSFPSGKVPGGDLLDPTGTYKLLGPPMANGHTSAPLDVEGSGFLISDSDAAGGSDDIGSKSEFWATTPSFSTLGSGDVWFHADAEIEANNNGECVADVAVSTDGGTTWIQVFAMVEAQRPIKGYNRGKADGVEPGYEGGAVTDGYPVLGSASLTKSWGGIHGRLHLPLPAQAKNQPDVRVRVRYYEPADAWWIALDNIVIDDVPAPAGSTAVLDETFENGIPSTWKKTTSGSNSWGTEPARDAEGHFYRNFTYNDEEGNSIKQFVNIDLLREAEARRAAGTNVPLAALIKLDTQSFTDFPDLLNTNPSEGKLDGRFLMMLAGQGYALRSDSTDESEINDLDTPALDLKDATGVYFQFDSEALPYSASTRFEAQVSVDNGQTFETIFTYMGALIDGGEGAYFMRHHLEVPQAIGKSGVIFRFHAQGGDSQARGFWAVDNVKVTVNKAGAEPIHLTAGSGAAGKVVLNWTGGNGPFTLQKKTALGDAWSTVSTVAARTITVDAVGTAGFYRIVEGAAP